MKKIYFNPTIEVVKIQTSRAMLVPGSLSINDEGAGKDGNGDYNDARFDDFDWDEEEY